MLLFVVLQIFVAFVIGFATAISLAVWALRNLNVFQLFGLERRARQLKREDVISASLRDRSQLQWREQQLHNEFVKRRFGELELDIERVVAVVNAYQEIVMQRLISVADPEAQSDAKKASKASSKSRKASHTRTIAGPLSIYLSIYQSREIDRYRCMMADVARVCVDSSEPPAHEGIRYLDLDD